MVVKGVREGETDGRRSNAIFGRRLRSASVVKSKGQTINKADAVD